MLLTVEIVVIALGFERVSFSKRKKDFHSVLLELFESVKKTGLSELTDEKNALIVEGFITQDTLFTMLP